MRAHRASWPVRLRRLGPLAVVAAVAVGTVAGLVVHPDDSGHEPSAEQVIVAGAAGLRWGDIDPERTPHLWRLAEQGSIGSLSVRSAHRPTCPADGWLTLGAGNWAAATFAPEGAPCPPFHVPIERTDSVGAQLPHQEQLVRHNQWELPWGAMPGALAGSVGCTVAVGQGAAVAAARSYGRVDRYRPALPADPDAAAELLGGHCELAIVDLGTVAGTGQEREAAVELVDAAAARVQAARPEESLLLVVGVADTELDRQLHVAVAHGPGLAPGWLGSATTGRTGYLHLVDIAPTVLRTIDRPRPEVPLAGHPISSHPERPDDLTEAVTELVAANDEAQVSRPVATWFLAALVVVQLALLAAVVPLLRHPGHPRWPTRWWRTVGPMLLVAAALAIPAALVVDGLPWWRATRAGGMFTLISVALLAIASLLVARTPIFRRTLGLVGAGAALAAGAVAVDLFTGSWLQLNGVIGYLAHDGGRYSGLSETGLGVVMAGTLLVAGCLAERVPRRRRPLVVLVIGAAGVVLVGSPYLGDEIGGAVALAAGVAAAAALSTGGWLLPHRLLWASLVGLAVVTAVAVFDLRRPAEERSGLGSMLTQLAEGTSGFGLQRVSLANVAAFTASPLTVLAIGAGVFLWFALLRPWGGLKRLFGIHPALRAAMVGAVVAALAGGLLIGGALTVAGAAAAVGVPLLTLASLRLRERSAERAQQVPPGGMVAGRRGAEVLE